MGNSDSLKSMIMDNNMTSLRILSHGQITDLSEGFKLEHDAPFSIFVIHKVPTLVQYTTVKCRCLSDRGKATALPVILGDWSPAMVTYISPKAIDLNQYDVYWGSGANI